MFPSDSSGCRLLAASLAGQNRESGDVPKIISGPCLIPLVTLPVLARQGAAGP